MPLTLSTGTRRKLSLRPKVDLKTSGGLVRLAKTRGLGKQAQKITQSKGEQPENVKVQEQNTKEEVQEEANAS